MADLGAIHVLPFALAAIITVATLTGVELVYGASLRSSRPLNLLLWVIRGSLSVVLIPFVALTVPYSLIDGAKLPFWSAFLIFLLAMDLGEYLFHRAQHSIPWLWKMHSLHHSDPDMNATTAERHFWGDSFIKSVTIWPAAALVIHPTVAVAFSYALMSLWNYVAHSAVPWHFGKLSWLLNSPAYHRRHHSSRAEHYNSNYAALLPIWDVMLGSYNPPDGRMPPTGLRSAPNGLVEALAWPLIYRENEVPAGAGLKPAPAADR
jgi:sterol desaturase/sphingolipid hydroxylase (fatty acid hydroxylase superfamily)